MRWIMRLPWRVCRICRSSMKRSSKWRSLIGNGPVSLRRSRLFPVGGVMGCWVDPSCVLRMSNIITLEDLEEEEDYQALLEDLRQGCEQLGQIVSMHVPRLQVDYGVRMECRMERRCRVWGMLSFSIQPCWRQRRQHVLCDWRRLMRSRYKWIITRLRCTWNR